MYLIFEVHAHAYKNQDKRMVSWVDFFPKEVSESLFDAQVGLKQSVQERKSEGRRKRKSCIYTLIPKIPPALMAELNSSKKLLKV